MKNKHLNQKSFKSLIALLLLVSLSGCGGSASENPNNYGARAGEDGAKYFKEQNPGQLASEDSAGQYCATMAEEGAKQNGWTIEETMQAADSCSIWFTTEMFR